MSDVVLVNPALSTLMKKKESTSLNVAPPLGLVCMGTYLKKNGFSVKIIDALVDDAEDEIKKAIGDALFVGFSAMSSQVAHALELSRYIRKIDSAKPIVWGGTHATLFPEQTLKDNDVDFIITKEGEETLVELAEMLNRSNESDRDFSRINGLGYKEGGRLRINKDRQFFDMSKMPFLDWGLVKIDRYIKTEINGKVYKSMYIHSSRGCPSRCTFCINTIINKCIWRSMDSERVLDEIEHLLNEYKVNNIWFREENFFSNKTRVKEICEGIKKRGLNFTWLTTVRADYFNQNYLNDSFMKLLNETGCIRLSLGIESGSPRILKYIKKGEVPEDAKRAAILCNRYDIKPVFSFMTGLPTETREDAMMTIKLIKELKRLAPKGDIIGPQIFRPYPGSEMYDWCRENGFREPDSLRGWTDPKILMETGFVSTRNLPWIKDPDFMSMISMSIPYAFNMSLKEALTCGSMQKTALSLSAKLRVRTGMWALPFEKKVFDTIYKKRGSSKTSDVNCE